MRLAVTLLLGLLMAGPTASGQGVKPPLPTASQPDVPAYRLIRKAGLTYVVTEFHLEKGNYITTDLAGKIVQHRADMVVSIDPLTAEEAQSYASAAASSGPGHGAKMTARTSARTNARKSSRPTIHDLNRDIASNPAAYGVSLGGPSGGSSGTFVGPRGGVYHFSASGNKVYDRH